MEKNLTISIKMIEIVNEHGDKQTHYYDVIFADGRVVYKENDEIHTTARTTPFTFYQFMNEVLKSKYCRKLVADENWKAIMILLLHFYKYSDSGKYGKIMEIIVKLYLHGYRGRIIVSPRGHVDLKHKGVLYECKSNCGDLCNILYDTIKAQGVLYSEDNERDCVEPWNVRIYELNEFVECFKTLGLIRKKRGTDGIPRWAIQSYKNSKRKHNALVAMQNEHAKIETIRQQ